MSASDTDINLRGPNRTLSGCEDGEFDRLYINIDDKYLEDRYLKAKFCYQYGFFVPIMLFAFGAMALVQPQVELNAWEMTLPESQRRKLLIRLRLLELKWARKNVYGLLLHYFCFFCYYLFLFKSS